MRVGEQYPEIGFNLFNKKQMAFGWVIAVSDCLNVFFVTEIILTSKNKMRDINYLIQLFPDKTGKELLEIQEQDKLEDEKEYQRLHEEDLKLVEDINTNGGYYRGRFGIDQYFYYRFFNLHLEDDKIYCDCEHLVLFSGEGDSRITERFSVEIRTESYKDIEKYGLDFYERVTVKEWDAVIQYFRTSPKQFWPEQKKVE